MNNTENVYRKFVDFEERAAGVYLAIAAHFPDNHEISTFWRDMAAQEKQHAGLLESCMDQRLVTANVPSEPAVREAERLFDSLEQRAAAPSLDINEAFQIAVDLESSEINDLTCKLTTPAHQSIYLFHRKIASFPSEHIGNLIKAGRRFGATDSVFKKLA